MRKDEHGRDSSFNKIRATFLEGPTVVWGLGGALRLELTKRRRGGDADRDRDRALIGEIDCRSSCLDTVASQV